MKRMFAKCGMKSLLAMFFVAVGLFFTANRVEAQTIQHSTATSPSGVNWKSESAAIEAAKVKVTENVDLLGNYIPSQPAYKLVYARIIYYKSVVEQINAGFGVGNAASFSLNNAATLGGVDTQTVLNRTQLSEIYAEAVETLKQ